MTLCLCHVYHMSLDTGALVQTTVLLVQKKAASNKQLQAITAQHIRFIHRTFFLPTIEVAEDASEE